MRVGRNAVGVEHGCALVGHGQVGGAGGDDDDALGRVGRAGRHTTVVPRRVAPGLAASAAADLVVVGTGEQHGPVRRRRAARRRSPTHCSGVLPGP